MGTRLAYTAEHLSLAIIEYFVHMDREDLPKDLVVATAEIPDAVSRITISANQLPANWRESPAPPELAEIGDRFARDRPAAILIVPSSLVPTESNWLINPRHPNCSRIRVGSLTPFEYDPRFLK